MNGKSAFEYKVFLSPDGKECFRYKFAEDTEAFHQKSVTKKDFDFTQSLLDFLYLDVEKHAKLFKTAAVDAKALMETRNEKYIPRIKKSVDKIAGLHVYFEHLRLDWYCRVDRLNHSNDLAALLPYEDLANIPDILPQRQQKAFDLIENILDFTSPDKPVQDKMVQYYSMRYDVFSMPFRFIAQTTCFEMADGAAFTEVFYPSDVYDLLSYFMRLCVEREQVFKRCKSCGDYFALTGYSTTEYCDREYGNTGKTCREIGANISYQRKMDETPAIAVYNKAYKQRFARIRRKKLTKEEFDAWAKLARQKRDECIAGNLPFGEYVQWLDIQ